MPRRGFMDYYMARMDGRNPYGSRGGYVSSRDPRDRARRMDRGMDCYEEDYRDDMADYARSRGRERNGRYADSAYSGQDQARGRRDYERGGQYDSHYEPIEVMGRFNGYYGMGEEDYARRRDYAYDMARGRGRRDYAYDYGYDYADDSRLSPKELEHWTKRLMDEIEEKDKPMLKKETITKKAKDMGITFDKFSEDEFYVTTLMIFSDYSKTLGTSNIDQYLRISKDFLTDEDSELKYGEKLCAYLCYVVEGM